MRTTRRQRCQCMSGPMIEMLEARLVFDGSAASSMPPVPVVDFDQPIDLAFLDALGDDLHILSGDGDAGPWKDQWVLKPGDEGAATVVAGYLGEEPAVGLIGAGRGPDLSWLDDASGDGVSDADIYAFGDVTPQAAATEREGSEEVVAGGPDLTAGPTGSALSWLATPVGGGLRWDSLSEIDVGGEEALSGSLVLPSLILNLA